MGMNRIHQSAVEAETLNNIISHPSLKQGLHNPRHYEEVRPQGEWLIKAIRTIGYQRLKSP